MRVPTRISDIFRIQQRDIDGKKRDIGFQTPRLPFGRVQHSTGTVVLQTSSLEEVRLR
jgi:hypothetical protein